MIVWGGADGYAEAGIDTLSTGARYCADSCAVPAVLYRDIDGDGYGNAGVTQVTCAHPAGWTAIAGDCNDGDPLVWHAPIEVPDLRLSGAGPTVLTWTDERPLAGPGTLHDLVSGALGPTGGVSLSSAGCLQSSDTAGFTDTRPAPPVGSGFWYLVRARNSCGTGSYGSGERDSAIAVCP
jgi:hypothetical protein